MKKTTSFIVLISLLVSGCAHNNVEPEPTHMVVGKNSFGKSKTLVDYMKKHHIRKNAFMTKLEDSNKTIKIKKKTVEIIKTIRISNALKKLKEKDGNTYVLSTRIGDFSFPYPENIENMTFNSLSNNLQKNMDIKLEIIQNKNTTAQPKIVQIVSLRGGHFSKIIDKRDIKISAANNLVQKKIRLDKPMTLKKFFNKLEKIKHKTYVLKGNDNIPMNKNVYISTIAELSKYLKETKGITLVEHKQKYFSSIEIKR